MPTLRWQGAETSEHRPRPWLGKFLVYAETFRIWQSCRSHRRSRVVVGEILDSVVRVSPLAPSASHMIR